MNKLRRAATAPFIGAVRAYQLTLGPIVGGRCRFHPSCSNYALDAYRIHGPVRGSWLTLRRLARCHPWGGSGIDPVPGSEPHQPDKPTYSAHDRDRQAKS